MNYTRLGRTGLRVSCLGLGGHEYRWGQAGNIVDGRHTRFNPERERVVARALERGVNYFDTTYFEEAQSLGHVLQNMGKLNDVIINGMIIDPVRRSMDMTAKARKAFVADELDTRLQLLNRDHFDVFMLCAIDHEYSHNRVTEMVEIYERHREAGKFRFLGVSCHIHKVLLDFLGLDTPVDVVMFPYNYAVEHAVLPSHEGIAALDARIKERDLGAVAMKPLCWTMYGIPFTAITAGTAADVPRHITNAFAWQTTQGRIHTSVTGVETVAELDVNLDGVDADPDESLLAPYREHHGRLDLLLRNGILHSAEVQERIANRAKNILKTDCGSDLAAYAAVLAERDGK